MTFLHLRGPGPPRTAPFASWVEVSRPTNEMRPKRSPSSPGIALPASAKLGGAPLAVQRREPRLPRKLALKISGGECRRSYPATRNPTVRLRPDPVAKLLSALRQTHDISSQFASRQSFRIFRAVFAATPIAAAPANGIAGENVSIMLFLCHERYGAKTTCCSFRRTSYRV